MPSSNPSGYETNIYSHRDEGMWEENRSHRAPSYDANKLPIASSAYERGPLIMVEPSYATKSNGVWLHIRGHGSFSIDRYTAEQLRDALIKVCQKPLQDS